MKKDVLSRIDDGVALIDKLLDDGERINKEYFFV